MKEVNSKAGAPLVLYKSGGPQYKSVCVCVCVWGGGGGGGGGFLPPMLLVITTASGG